MSRFIMAMIYESAVRAWNTTHTDNWHLWDLIGWFHKEWDMP